MPWRLDDYQADRYALLRDPNGGAGRSLAIFVHGFNGNYLTTWGSLSGMLEQNAEQDPVLSGWDFLFQGYATQDISSYLDIARLLATQWDLAASGKPPFRGAYVRFALLGHSLGTLGIRQFLCAGDLQPPDTLKSLHSVTLFGTPLNGSRLAFFGGLVGGEIADALKPANPQLRMLRSWNQTVQPSFAWSKVRIILGTDDQVVGHEYADLIDFAGDATPKYLVNYDHKHLVKPSSWANSTIRDYIVGALQ